MPRYQPATYREQGGDRFVVASGGALDVQSGGEIDVESGGSLKLAGTAVTATAAELNALDGITATVAELNILDGVTATAAELNILDGVTATAAELNILDGVTATAAELNIMDGVTSTAAELNILDGVTATAAELNRNCDQTTRLIAAGATLTLTVADHEGRTIALNQEAGSVVTLPVGGAGVLGARFRFKVQVTATTNSHIIKVGDAADIMQGVILALSDDTAAVKGWEAAADSDTITFNRTTTGTAKIGHFIEVEHISSGVWAVHGIIAQNGAEATPFSATVS